MSSTGNNQQQVNDALKQHRQEALAVLEDNLRNPGGHAIDLSVQAGIILADQASKDRALLAKHLSTLMDVRDIDKLRSLSLALQGAQIEFERNLPSASKQKVQELVPKARKARERLLRYVPDFWPDNENVDREVAYIREGRGHWDLSKDCIALVEMYKTHEKDMDPDTQKDINYKKFVTQANDLGNALMQALSQSDPASTQLRNGVWTLFHQCYTKLQDCGHFLSRQLKLSGPSADDRYPPLGRMSRRSSSSTTPTPEANTDSPEATAETATA